MGGALKVYWHVIFPITTITNQPTDTFNILIASYFVEFAAQRPPFETYDKDNVEYDQYSRPVTASQVPLTAASTVRFQNVLSSQSSKKESRQNTDIQLVQSDTELSMEVTQELSKENTTVSEEIKKSSRESSGVCPGEVAEKGDQDEEKIHETKIIIQSPSDVVSDADTRSALKSQDLSGGDGMTTANTQDRLPPLNSCN